LILNETFQEVVISQTNSTSSIIVNDNRGTYGGKYTCEAINVAGISSINFNVECKWQ